jgi:hypothetical protein
LKNDFRAVENELDKNSNGDGDAKSGDVVFKGRQVSGGDEEKVGELLVRGVDMLRGWRGQKGVGRLGSRGWHGAGIVWDCARGYGLAGPD